MSRPIVLPELPPCTNGFGSWSPMDIESFHAYARAAVEADRAITGPLLAEAERLCLEYCEFEMSPELLADWEGHQEKAP